MPVESDVPSDRSVSPLNKSPSCQYGASEFFSRPPNVISMPGLCAFPPSLRVACTCESAMQLRRLPASVMRLMLRTKWCDVTLAGPPLRSGLPPAS